MPCDKVWQESVSKLGHWTTRQTSSTGISCCSAMSFFAMSCWLPAPRMTSAKCIKCIKLHQIASFHCTETLWAKSILGWADCGAELCHFSSPTESTHPRHQGPASGNVAAPLKKQKQKTKKNSDFHNVFFSKKNVEKKHNLTVRRWKKDNVSGPWQCAKLDRRVRAAAWHQPLPVLPNNTFIYLYHLTCTNWHVDQMKRFHIAHLIFMFSQLGFVFTFCCSALPLLPCSANVLASFQSGEGLPSKRPSSRAQSWQNGIANGTMLSRHFTFRDKIS